MTCVAAHTYRALLCTFGLLVLAPARAEDPPEVPPSRTIKGILADLAAAVPDTKDMAQANAIAAAAMPDNLDRKAQVDFLVDRAAAFFKLGNTARQLEDLRQAAPLAQRREIYGSQRNVDRGSLLNNLMGAEWTAGDPRAALAMADQLLAEQRGPGSRLQALERISQYQRQTGNLGGMRKTMEEAEAVFKAAPSAAGWNTWRLNWTKRMERMRAWQSYAIGKPEEAELAMHRAIRAAKEFAPLAPALQARGLATGSLEFYETIANEGLELDLVSFLLQQNKVSEAEYYARNVLAGRLGRAKVINASLRGPIQALGDVMMSSGRYADAGELYRQSMMVMDRGGYSPASVAALSSRLRLARSLAAQERWSEALKEFADLRQAAATIGFTRGRFGGSNAFEGMSLIATGQTDAGLRMLRSLVRWYRDTDRFTDPDAILARGFLAIAQARGGLLREAAAGFDEVMPLIAGSESLLVDAKLTPLKTLQRKWVVDGYLAFIARQASAGDREFGDTSRLWQALVAVDAINGQGVQRAIQDAAVRSAGGVTGLAELARRAQDLKNEIDTLYAILGLAVGEEGQRIPGAVAEIRQRLTAAQGELKDANARIDRGSPAYRNLLRPKTPTPREVQNALRPGETALLAYPGPDATYVWAIPQQGRIAFHVAPLGRAAIDERVQKLRRALDPNAFGIRAAIPDFDLATAHELHAALIKPVEATLGTSRHVLVIAHGPLAQVPFALLPTEAMTVRGDPDVAFAEYKPVPWLLRRHAMTQLPSLASLVTLRAQPAGNPNRQSFAGFGDPVFAKTMTADSAPAGTTLRGMPVAMRSFSRGMALDSSELAQLPRLPDTAEEIRGIAASLKADPARDIFLGASANEKEVKTRNLANRKVIAFATHGLIPGELNGLTQPALALSAPDVAGIDGDGLLTLEEVLGLKLDADWVVLSACNTAAGDGAGAEAITGLGRAFFYAGTRALLVSNWPVETVSARLITTGIFARQAADAALTRAEALRRTMLDLIDNGVAKDAAGKPVYSYSHPLFWAPFSLIGDGG